MIATNSDLRKTNDCILRRRAKRDRAMADYKRRTTQRRDRVRRLELLTMGIGNGWLR